MGREVRRVNIDFKHPQKIDPNYDITRSVFRAKSRMLEDGMMFVPLLNEKYADALESWELERSVYDRTDYTFEEWHGERPKPEWYMPDEAFAEPLGYCLYETVSEGTPCTPVFATEDELIDWLATKGEDYEQKPLRPEAAAKLVKTGWAPSLMVIGREVYTSSDLDKFDERMKEIDDEH